MIWTLRMEFNHAVETGLHEFMQQEFTGDSYEEHCAEESKPYRFI